MNSSYAPPAASPNENKNVAVHAKCESGMCLSRVLGDMTNCLIGNITGFFCVKKTEKEIEQEFNAVTRDLPF